MTEPTELDRMIEQLGLEAIETYRVDQDGNTIKVKIY